MKTYQALNNDAINLLVTFAIQHNLLSKPFTAQSLAVELQVVYLTAVDGMSSLRACTHYPLITFRTNADCFNGEIEMMQILKICHQYFTQAQMQIGWEFSLAKVHIDRIMLKALEMHPDFESTRQYEKTGVQLPSFV